MIQRSELRFQFKTTTTTTKSYCQVISVIRVSAVVMSTKVCVSSETKRMSSSHDVGMYFCRLESQIILFKVTKLYIYTVPRLDKIGCLRIFH